MQSTNSEYGSPYLAVCHVYLLIYFAVMYTIAPLWQCTECNMKLYWPKYYISLCNKNQTCIAESITYLCKICFGSDCTSISIFQCHIFAQRGWFICTVYNRHAKYPLLQSILLWLERHSKVKHTTFYWGARGEIVYHLIHQSCCLFLDAL